MVVMLIIYSFCCAGQAREGWQGNAARESGGVQEHGQLTRDDGVVRQISRLSLPARSSNRRFQDLQVVTHVGISVDVVAQVITSAQFAATNSSLSAFRPLLEIGRAHV